MREGYGQDYQPDPNYLSMFVIYHRPMDFPGHEFVIREVVVGKVIGELVHGPYIMAADTLDQVREALPWAANFRIERDPSDPPHIVETWM